MTPINNRVLEGKYEFIREIKKGGFGIVYYGIDRNLNKPIAIKEIAPNLLENSQYMDMFQEEALNIAKLSHHNIVHIYELIKTDDGRLYIIMEYIDGIDLEKILRRGRILGKKIPPHLAVYIIAEICLALDYAHQRRDAFTNKPLNLVHQDISPSNIMISRYGGVKLIDFGIALVQRHQAKQKRNHQLRGKIPYMAPEQLIMGNHLDHRSDIFSLGVVLYECLVGQRLFNSREDIIAATKNNKWFKKTIKGKKIPSALEKILSKALEIDLTKRYQNANHLYIDLLQYLISCDIVGELMDYLADYVSEYFQDEESADTNNNNNRINLEELLEHTAQSEVSNLPESEHWNEILVKDEYQGFKRAPSHSSFVSSHEALKPNGPPFSDDEDEEELKTEIDVLRISARNDKRHLKYFSFGALIALITFGVLDTIIGWTKVGTSIYDWLFPPAIEIATVPSNAQVFIDGKALEGRTPITMDEISPGTHRLELFLEQYTPIVKSLFVPRRGTIRVQGEAVNGKHRSYLFRFNTEIEINSFPPGASVYLNDIRFNQKTPCKVSWEVGTPLAIEMERNGFERLTGYSLNTMSGYDEVEDRRVWETEVTKEPYIKYSINGIFRKRIIIESLPEGAEIYTTESNNAIGVTGKNNSILLTAGVHEITLKKENFIPTTVKLKIAENSNDKVFAVLSRRVYFTAFDELDISHKDIGALVVSLDNGRKNILTSSKTTPFEMVLSAYPYSAVFQKDGYQPTKVEVSPESQVVRAEMKSADALVKVKVLDALSLTPIHGAKISYNSVSSPQIRATLFQHTDVEGEASGKIAEGNYIFNVEIAGYLSSNKNLSARPGTTYNLVFKIYPANQ